MLSQACVQDETDEQTSVGKVNASGEGVSKGREVVVGQQGERIKLTYYVPPLLFRKVLFFSPSSLQ